MKLKVTVSKTSDGLRDYVQIMSDDYTTVNVTSVADAIEIVDTRPTRKAKKLSQIGGRPHPLENT